MRNPAPLLFVLLLAPLTAAAQDIPHTTFTLDNGLQVVLHEDHSLPLVTVNVAYRLGSMDEPEGHTGYAHLAEHLMFMGTERVPTGALDQIVEAEGGWTNASTGDDMTMYYMVGPSSLLPALLWLEADRIERIAQDMDLQKLDLQRDVVRNERRQGYENEPYGAVWLTVPEVMYPEGHPYGHPVIGSHEDLVSTTVEDVRQLYRAGYALTNASLVVAGDLDPVSTRALVEELFGDLPSLLEGPLPRPEPTEVPLPSPARVTLEDQVELPQLTLVWPSPPLFAPGDAELDLLSTILQADKHGRLSKALMMDRPLAQDVSAAQYSSLLSSQYVIEITAAPGADRAEIEATVEAELARLREEGPGAQEVVRAQNQWEAMFAAGLESLHSRASRLNAYWVYTGETDRIGADVGRYRTATAEGIREVARRVFVPEHLTLWVVPEGEKDTDDVLPAWPENTPVVEHAGYGIAVAVTEAVTEAEAEAEAGAEAETRVSVNPRDEPPAPAPTRPFEPPEPEEFFLDNDLRVWVVPRDTVPAIQAVLFVPTGSSSDPAGREGLASLTADLLDEGAGDRDASELAQAVDDLGASLDTWAVREAMGVSCWMLSRNARDSFALMADVVARPRLARSDLERVRGLTLGYLGQRALEPNSVATVSAWRQFFGDGHAYAAPTTGYIPSVTAIKPGHVKKTYRTAFRPDRATLVVVGDTSVAEMRVILEATFGDWRARGPRRDPAISLPDPAYATADTALQLYLVDRPGSPQTVIRVLQRSEPIGSEHWVEDHLVNGVLGGSFTSRLNANLREDKGWTYGAGSYLVQMTGDGALLAGTSVAAEVTGPALGEILGELRALDEGGLSEDEATKATATYLQEVVETHSSIASVSYDLAERGWSGVGVGILDERLAHASTLDAAALSARAAELLTPSDLLVVLVGDGETIRAQLEADGIPAPIPLDADGTPLADAD